MELPCVSLPNSPKICGERYLYVQINSSPFLFIVSLSLLFFDPWFLSLSFPFQVEEAVFVATIEHINALFDEAEALNCKTYSEGCLACLTGYTIHFCFKTTYERVSS